MALKLTPVRGRGYETYNTEEKKGAQRRRKSRRGRGRDGGRGRYSSLLM